MAGWFAIFRLGLVQVALGAIVVLTTSTLNRIMVVEMALPAVLPGALVAFHYGIQVTRPNWGFLSDTGGRRTIWILTGMVALALGAIGAAFGVILFPTSYPLALAVSVLAYALIGAGVGASGTSLLALLTAVTAPHRRPAAATMTWLMMILGIAVTAGVGGSFLDPYSPARLMEVVSTICGGAVILTTLAVFGIERNAAEPARREAAARFIEGLAEVWSERSARNFTIFVFFSMTAYFMQELILEPYAGLVFGFTPGQSTSLSGMQNGGVFIGMLAVGVLATGLRKGSTRTWVFVGCIGSAVSLAVIALLGTVGTPGTLPPAVVSLGFFNGMFAVAAIASMMELAGKGRDRREGTRLGLWGAAQALAAGFGGLLGAGAVDLARRFVEDPEAFGIVFLTEAALFAATAAIALKVIAPQPSGTAELVPGE